MAASTSPCRAALRNRLRRCSPALAGRFGCLLLLLVLVGCASSGPNAETTSPVDQGGTTASPSATESMRAPTVSVGTGPHRMVEADGLVWVSTSVGDVVAVDAVTGTVTHRIGTGMQLSGIAVANGRVWVAANREGLLLEIDPATDIVAGQVMIGGGVRGVTAVGTDVWVAAGDQGQLVRVDATSATVTGSTPAGPSPAQIVSTPAGLWVTDRDNDGVVLADPDGGAVLATVDVGGPTIGIAADEQSVWVCRTDIGEVVRIDQATRAVDGRGELPSTCFGAALAEGGLWVGGTDGFLRRLDPDSLSGVGETRVGASPVGIVQVGAEIWTADSDASTVSRVEISSVGPG